MLLCVYPCWRIRFSFLVLSFLLLLSRNDFSKRHLLAIVLVSRCNFCKSQEQQEGSFFPHNTETKDTIPPKEKNKTLYANSRQTRTVICRASDTFVSWQLQSRGTTRSAESLSGFLVVIAASSTPTTNKPIRICVSQYMSTRSFYL